MIGSQDFAAWRYEAGFEAGKRSVLDGQQGTAQADRDQAIQALTDIVARAHKDRTARDTNFGVYALERARASLAASEADRG